jgi:hypothetical protein
LNEVNTSVNQGNVNRHPIYILTNTNCLYKVRVVKAGFAGEGFTQIFGDDSNNNVIFD